MQWYSFVINFILFQFTTQIGRFPCVVWVNDQFHLYMKLSILPFSKIYDTKEDYIEVFKYKIDFKINYKNINQNNDFCSDPIISTSYNEPKPMKSPNHVGPCRDKAQTKTTANKTSKRKNRRVSTKRTTLMACLDKGGKEEE